MGFSEQELCALPYNQQHLFDGGSEEHKKALVTQLNEIDGKLSGGLKGYLERARGLLADAKTGRNPFEGFKPKIPNGTKLTGEDGPGSNRYAEFERLGMQELSKTCFCLVAGGLGERLGYPGIKIGITAEVTTGATFMEIYCRHILAFQAYARKVTNNATLELPLAIMTSGDTHQMTLELLEANSRFGLSASQITVMKQEKVPALMDVDARIAAKDGIVLTKPHGHGDVHSLLHQNGLPTKWVGEGRRWLLLFQDTNPLPFRSVCAVLGVSVAQNFAMNSVTVPRFPGEAVGGIAMLEKEGSHNLTVNVEYNQLDPLLKTSPVGGDVADESGFSPYPGNINILVFGLSVMADRLATTGGIVPEFCNPKWAGPERSKFKSPTRLECMMQDFPRLFSPDDKVGFTMLERLLCFTCVKNSLDEAAKKTPPDCALSAEADIYACNARLLTLAGSDVQIEAAEDVTFLGVTAKMGPRIVLQPSFGISLEDMKTKVQGKWRVSRNSVLVLDGEVIVNGLDLDGALRITGCGQASDVVVRNAGRELVAIPEADLVRQPPSLQIRGYLLNDGDMEVRNIAKGGPLHAGAAHGPRDPPMSEAAMKYLLVRPKVPAPLDPNFCPFILAKKNYLKWVRGSSLFVDFALERTGGLAGRERLPVFAEDHEDVDASIHLAGIMIQQIMWERSGFRLLLAGPPRICEALKRDYSPGGKYNFEITVMPKACGTPGTPFEVRICDVKDLPPNKDAPVVCGKNADGCRLAFDLGKSDIKTVAVKDNIVLSSKETEWDVTNPDPQYHWDMILTAMKETAKELPGERVDAIGGSATGTVGANNEATWCDIFPNVPPDVYQAKVVDIFQRLAKEFGNPPLRVINDGEVTALAAISKIGKGNVLGISMGSSEGGGYANADGNLLGWINEMCYMKLDMNPEAPTDPWQPHCGMSHMYLGQRGATKLAEKGGVDLPDEMKAWHPAMQQMKHEPHAQCLKLIQAAMKDSAKKPQASLIYRTVGVYLGYGIAMYCEHYKIDHLMILGRVSTGEGGQIMLDTAKEVLNTEFPQYGHIQFHTPDEQFKRVGQCIAAAALPPLKK